MSYQDYQKAISLVVQCDCFASAGQQTDELIGKIEQVFGFSLSRQHYEYYKEFGWISFFGSELYGIYKNAFEGIYTGNAVIATIQDRRDYNLPLDWIPLYDYDDGYMMYLNYADMNLEGEPRVILGIFTGKQYEVSEIIAEDLGAFLLELVDNQ